MADLYEIISNINKQGYKINRGYLEVFIAELKNLALKQAYLLMDKGYISNLTLKDFSELIKALSEEFGDDINYLFNAVDGTITLTAESTDVASKLTKNEDFKSVLYILHDYCYAVELLKEIRELLPLITAENIIYPKFTFSEKEIKSQVSNFFNRREFATILEGREKLSILNAKSLIYFEFLVSIGIPEEALLEHKKFNRGMILKEFSFAEEVNICNYIMDFNVQCNTKFAKKYIEGKKFYYNPKTRKRDKERYLTGYIEDINTILDSVVDGEIIPRLITKYSFIIEQTKPELSRELYSVIGNTTKVVNDLKRIWENSGLYVLDWNEGVELNKINALLGNTGEFISEKAVLALSSRMSAENHKIVLNNMNRAKPTRMLGLSYLNRELIATEYFMYRVEDLGLPYRVGVDIDFVYTDINKVYKMYSVNNIQSLFKAILRDVKRTESIFKNVGDENYYKLVEADIIMVHITKDCGLEYISQVPLDKRLYSLYENDYELLCKASYEAEKYIKENGIFKQGGID